MARLCMHPRCGVGHRDVRTKEKAFSPAPLGWRMDKHVASGNARAYRLFLGRAPETEITYSLPGVRIEHAATGRFTYCGLTACTPVDEQTTAVHHVMYWDCAGRRGNAGIGAGCCQALHRPGCRRRRRYARWPGLRSRDHAGAGRRCANPVVLPAEEGMASIPGRKPAFCEPDPPRDLALAELKHPHFKGF